MHACQNEDQSCLVADETMVLYSDLSSRTPTRQSISVAHPNRAKPRRLSWGMMLIIPGCSVGRWIASMMLIMLSMPGPTAHLGSWAISSQ
ncbi:hypothetical protein BO78DRAFT_86672 [Aspergillus sclerotiicarbonarius CBS 121057]|uniref:Uncharacterized protein n=1 Tax=Aspergillus sclerotiicarbonarius (strain CBS 121057 / IBT 28362) TaxID=1448318 RepID=A0A319EDL4_ASPSB|nr:hypothetical protein BO78DRAFT_86672 [Aspergillus sclerotiicarbonarius CBS 121057]